jgi:hypothetical protein
MHECMIARNTPMHDFSNYYSRMNKFVKRTFSETLRLLLLGDKEVPKKQGKINVTQAAAKIGISQPTVKRWLDRYSESPEDDKQEILCRRYRISRDQLLGRAPIPSIDGEVAVDGFGGDSDSVLPRIREIVAELPSQHAEMQHMFVDLYETTKKQYDRLRIMQRKGEVDVSLHPEPKRRPKAKRR